MGPCCLVVQKKEGRSGLEKRSRLWARPRHLFPGISSLLTGALPVYFCSKSREDLFPSQEPIYSAFSFSNPVTLWLFFVVWLRLPNNKRNHSLSFLTPCWGSTSWANAGTCHAQLLPWAPARWVWGPTVLSRPLKAGIGAHTRAAAVGRVGAEGGGSECSPSHSSGAIKKKWDFGNRRNRPKLERHSSWEGWGRALNMTMGDGPTGFLWLASIMDLSTLGA